MEEIEFDVSLTVKDLYLFSMRHTYVSISGIFGLLISIGSWLICLLRFQELDVVARAALFVIGCLFTIVQPLMLYGKAGAQLKKNENINDSLHYCLSEEGITVTQGEQEASVKWYQITRRVVRPGAIYLYTSPVRAFIFPLASCGGQFQAVCEMVDRHRRDEEPEEEGA